MIFYVFKILVTVIIIIAVTEISKSSTFLGGFIASLPLISFLSFIWLYIDTKNTEHLGQLSMQIFWLVIPTLLFFIVFAGLVKIQSSFVLSMALATLAMFIGYGITTIVLKHFA